jgi:GNAT superfamily N-acetyltransferase
MPVDPVPTLPSAAETVLTFLESVGRRSEAELYLGLFRKLPKESFAIIAPGGPVLRHALGSLVEQLRFLADLGLFAPVVLGLFDPQAAAQSSERLARRLPAVGLEPCPHPSDEQGLTGRLREELRQERVPIVHFVPGSADARERLLEVGRIAQALQTRKLVLVRRRGGLGPQSEQRIELAPGHGLTARAGGISVINLRTDLEGLRAARKLRKEDMELLEDVALLLDCAGPGRPETLSLLVNVTSPFNLLKELFTIKGAGTLIKGGTPIEHYTSYENVDRDRLRSLLETSFGRPLSPSFFDTPPLSVYLERDYRGAAIVLSSKVAPFLSKFAALPAAQGEGIGQDLWQAALRDHRSLFWRARPENPAVAWYVTLCDGMLRADPWQVFWRGLPPEKVPELVAEALARPPDFDKAQP